MADALALGVSSPQGSGGSNPLLGTKYFLKINNEDKIALFG